MQEIFFQEAQELHYEEIPQVTRAIYEGVDAQIGILSPSNTMALANVDPERQQALQKRNKPLNEMMLEKDRWVLTLFPTEALAQEAHMGLSEYEEFAFEAMGLNEDDPVRYWNEKSASRPAHREARGGARYPYRRSGHGPDALGRGTDVRELCGKAEHALRRSLYRADRGLGERNGLLRRTCCDSGARGLGRTATFRGGEGRRGERGKGEEYL